MPVQPASAEEAFTRPASGVWTVQGHGWGHGHGMSQWGANGAARQGVPYQTILGAYYPGTTLTTVPDSTIRVKLTVDSTQLRVSGSEGLIAIEGNGRVTALPSNVSQWRLVATGSGLRLDGLTTQWLTYGLGGSANVTTSVRLVNTQRVLRLWRSNGTSVDYRGEAVAYPSGWSVTTVLHLPLESYLRGVVPRESPASWPDHALRAQSVAARTYAVSQMRSASSGGTYDICDTTWCQVFGGTRSYSTSGAATQLEWASTDSAIAATPGQILTYGGQPAFTQFSSSNGGYSTAGSKPYLVAKPDPWSGTAPGDTVHAWTAKLPASSLEARYPAIGTLTRIVVTRRDGNGDWGGRVLGVRLEGTRGSVNVSGDDVKNARPYPTYSDGLRSMWWSLGSVPNAAPFGSFDLASGGDDTIRVAGWALDPDTAAPIDVHVYLDGANIAHFSASTSRPDVGAAFPTAGSQHGFDTTLPAPAGTHEVCVWAINSPAGDNPRLGCRTVTVRGAPFGSLDVVAASGRTVRVAGWTIDPDTTLPIDVHVYVDGVGVTALRANAQRPDVAAAHPSAGAGHGFDTTVQLSPGTHRVCVFAIDTPPPGNNPQLGCRSVTVTNAMPIGTVDVATLTSGGFRVAGWALDPDTGASIDVHLYVDGQIDRAVTASRSRPDVGAAFRTGSAHGYDVTVATARRANSVCVYAINVPAGPNPLLGCRTFPAAAT